VLLSEVIVPDGEHHLVLVVRTKEGDLVLDNLDANIRSVAMTYPDYQWVRIESPQNPKYWASVRLPMAAIHAPIIQSNQS
jgi:predicted transglutaminase-like cysteine proteinase